MPSPSLTSMTADARRSDAFKHIRAAEAEYATAETFIVLNDWASAAAKIRQTMAQLAEAAAAFDDCAARQPELTQ